MIDNPVLRKELLMRLRLRQIPLPSRIGILLALAACMLTIYYFVIVRYILLSNESVANAGYNTWFWVVGIQYMLICLIAPSITANAITQEKEQQTWEMLIFTRLMPGEIIFGKLLARLSTLLLLIALCFPIELVSWAVASHSSGSSNYISFSMVVMSYLTMLISTVFFATFGLYMSWLVHRTLVAIMLAYTFVVGALMIGTFMVTALMTSLFSDDFLSRCPLMWVNPVNMIVEALNPTMSPNTPLFLIFGLITYVMASMLMLWLMIIGYRRFAYHR